MFEKMDKDYVLHTYNREYINFKSGKSALLRDEQDREYIDLSSGIGVLSVGHSNSRVVDSICKQAGRLIHTSNLYLIEPQAKLAKRLVELSGYDMRCFFSNSGAEANEGAIKIARKYGEIDKKLKRYKIITLEHSFHGRTISTLKATAQKSMHNYFGPFPDGFVHAKDIDDIKELCDEHTVAVMIELIQGEGGVEPLELERVKELERFLKSRDILLIVDEVQTGIYRTGELLASNLYGISPDIVTVAKGLGGGVPIGAVMTTLKDIFSPGDHGSTFGGNYLVCSAALEVLDILEEYKNSGIFDEMMIEFHNSLKSLWQNYPDIIEREVGFGFMRGVRVKDSDTLSKILKEALKQRVLILKSGRNTVRFLPPLTISKDELDEGMRRVEKIFSNI